jgi:hypothetical protein
MASFKLDDGLCTVTLLIAKVSLLIKLMTTYRQSKTTGAQFPIITMAEKKETKKSWTYKELVNATGGGEVFMHAWLYVDYRLSVLLCSNLVLLIQCRNLNII